MRVKVRAQELLDLGYWTEYCDREGKNHYAVAEGLLLPEHEIEIEIPEGRVEAVLTVLFGERSES